MDMERRPVRIITTPPIVTVIGETKLVPSGILEMARWVKENRPECLPDYLSFDDEKDRADNGIFEEEVCDALFPHDGTEVDPFVEFRLPRERNDRNIDAFRDITGAELLPELAGRKCYDSFGLKAGKKSNAAYLQNVLGSTPPHASVLYHSHLTFFIGDTSRRLSQELFRNYVGSHADHEGSPSQESTRYTVHHGAYVAHPWDIDNAKAGMNAGLETYQRDCALQYCMYMNYVESEMHQWKMRSVERIMRSEGSVALGATQDTIRRLHEQRVKIPTDVKKAILGSAAQRHGWGFATSYVWTSNPIALIKMFKERDHAAADPEFQRLAHVWKKVCVMRWPNLFPMFVQEILDELREDRNQLQETRDRLRGM